MNYNGNCPPNYKGLVGWVNSLPLTWVDLHMSGFGASSDRPPSYHQLGLSLNLQIVRIVTISSNNTSMGYCHGHEAQSPL